jgi:zinc and cadmium transporter
MNLPSDLPSSIIGASLLVSFSSLSGSLVLKIKPEKVEKLVPYLVALAVGVLLGDAFIHLIPDAVAHQGSVTSACFTTLIGVFIFFVLEKGVRWRHDHCMNFSSQQQDVQPLAKMNLIGDGVHNFVDGILIAGSFLTDPMIGATTTFAIIAHEIPQEIGDVGALICGGFEPKKAVLYNFYCSLTVVVGAIFTLLLSQVAQSSLNFLLPIAAGGFIYIAATDMIPALHKHSSLQNFFGQSTIFASGIIFMQLIVTFENFLFSKP